MDVSYPVAFVIVLLLWAVGAYIFYKGFRPTVSRKDNPRKRPLRLSATNSPVHGPPLREKFDR